MRFEKILMAVALAGLSGILPALAETTVTITTSNLDCKVPPPAEVAAPATPNAAAGIAAEKNRNFALARANFKPLAESGNSDGERLYGILLMQNCTGIQDKEGAANWLGKAADSGDKDAEEGLAKAYMNGDGVAQDDAKAFLWLSQAAAAGQAGAEVDLGYFYLAGRGVPVDPYQGMVWTVKAGEQGLPAALFNISHGYFKGEALPQDNEKAAYYMAAAIERSTPAQRGRFVANINNLSRAISADDLKRASDRARRWSPGAGSLSDVLDDANRTRARTAKN
jgi:TPR repeat protein